MQLVDQLVDHLRQPGRMVDWIHAHYADAGLVGSLVSEQLGIPLVFTGHSLGREKQRRLLVAGGDRLQMEHTYAISSRIAAEERALAQADLVITSTLQEAEKQYSLYSNFQLRRAHVLSPGVDSSRFHPSASFKEQAELNQLLHPFLRDPAKPPLLAISRAVRRKNIPALVDAFGQSDALRRQFNLVLMLGCCDDPRQLAEQQREVFQQVFEPWIITISTVRSLTRNSIVVTTFPRCTAGQPVVRVCLSTRLSRNHSGSPCSRRPPVGCPWWPRMMGVPRTSRLVAATGFWWM